MHPFVSQMKKVAETNKSHRESAKKQLFEKMKQQQASNVGEESSEEGTIISDTKLERLVQQIEQLKRVIEKLEKAGAAKTEKLSSLQTTNQHLNRDLKAFKTELYFAKEKDKEAVRQLEQLNGRIRQLELVNRQKKDETQLEYQNLLEQKTSDLTNNNRKLEAENLQLKRTISRLGYENSGYKYQLKNEMEYNLNRINGLQELVEEQAKQIKYLEELNEIGANQQVVQICGTLLKKLDLRKASHQAAAEELQRELKRMLEKSRCPEQRSLDLDHKLYIHGYVVQAEEDYLFYDLEQRVYRILTDGIELKSDLPAKAYRIDDDTVKVAKQYSYHYAPQSISRRRKKTNPASALSTKEQNSHQAPLIFSRKLKVLVLGARNRNNYIRKLEDCNLQADWFDGYEESPEVLKQKWGAAQIIIVCTRHVPHFVLNILDRRDKRVECLAQDNVKSLLVRVRYTAVKLGLI
ncbi:hypothetical protein [Paenibacillus sp. 32352]|uniref:hypothetical protein n=1 Tax=Paenibacillus sp. 32352 TaxID=1969111 RepID=UPI0009AE6B54|nr:hypothetical protein [Paenibacillus sp. 32352]